MWLPKDFTLSYFANFVPNWIAFFLNVDVYLFKNRLHINNKIINFNPKLKAIFLKNTLSPVPLTKEKSVKIY